MGVNEVRQADLALMDAVARMVDEHPDLPAGRPMSCFARAVRQLREQGCSTDRLPVEAERLAGELLLLTLAAEAERR